MKTNIKNARLMNNLDTKDVAKRLQVSLRTYQNYENGTSEMPFELLLQTSKILNCSIDYLLGNATKGLIHLDSYSPEKQRAIELINKLNDNQTAMLLGYLAKMTDTPLEEVLSASSSTNQNRRIN